MISYLILCDIKGVFEVENYDFSSQFDQSKFSSLNREISELKGKGHKPRAKPS